MIVTAANGFAIGKDDEPLVNIPAVLQRTRRMTDGAIVIMGRKTLERTAGTAMLNAYKVIGLSKNKNYRYKGATIVHSIEELIKELEKEKTREAYCLGGESIFKALLPYTDTIHLTKINFNYEANRYFPNLKEKKDWHQTNESEESTYFDLEYKNIEYKKKK